jgi:hypothetical protein
MEAFLYFTNAMAKFIASVTVKISLWKIESGRSLLREE